MRKLNERLHYLVCEDLVPNAIHFLESRKKRNTNVCPKGVLLEGKKHFKKVKNFFEENKIFSEKGLEVRGTRRGLRNFFKKDKHLEEFIGDEWYKVDLNGYLEIYLKPGNDPPIKSLLESRYD